MKAKLALVAALTLASGPAFAAGDAAAGEKTFKQCQTCHSVVDDTGAKLAGTGAKVGPNLYGVFGRTAGTLEGFKYGDAIKSAGAAGLVWNEEQFVIYVQDPSKFLEDYLNDPKLKSKMMFKLKDAESAANVYAYLSQFSPAAQ